MERYRNYDGFKDIDTIEGRYLYAKKIEKELTEKIKTGEIQSGENIEYDDYLGYKGISHYKYCL